MKNIHLIPTGKLSRLFKDDFGKLFYSINIDQEQNHFKPQHIYITSDEKIKEGDYFINKHSQISGCVKALEKWLENNDSGIKKIILTTDQDLIKDGIQAIDDEFLEWFVKNPSCEVVEVSYDKDAFPYGVETAKGYGWYKIIIPQEEPKQETIEEAAENHHVTFTRDLSYAETRKESFIAGFQECINWQSERMYSLDQISKDFIGEDGSGGYFDDYLDFRISTKEKLTFKEWFNQNKK